MIPLISLFDYKGDVSKTTTAFNLGWAWQTKANGFSSSMQIRSAI